MSSKKASEKNQEAVRKMSLKPENRDCMDCALKSTPNVVMDFAIFVCSFCSGIHRSYQFKAKGISMTNFKDSEVEELSKGGNDKARKIWRATWDPNKFPLPKAYDERAIKDFIKRTYVEKQWYRAGAEGDEPRTEPLENIVPEPIPIEVHKKPGSGKAPTKPVKEPENNGFGNDRWDEEPAFEPQQKKPVTKPVTKPAPAIDPFFGGAGGEDDGFETAFPTTVETKQTVAPVPAKAAPVKPSIDLDSLFAPSGAPPATGYTGPPSLPPATNYPGTTPAFPPATGGYTMPPAYPPTYGGYPPGYGTAPPPGYGTAPPGYGTAPPTYPPAFGNPFAGGAPAFPPATGGFHGAYPPAVGAPAFPPAAATLPSGAVGGGNPFLQPFGAPAPAPSKPAEPPKPDPFGSINVFGTVKTGTAPAPVPAPTSKPAPKAAPVNDLDSFFS